MGAATNAATSKEATQLHARLLDEHTEEAFDLLAEMLLRPSLPEDEVDSERQVVLEEIAMYEDEPQERVHDVLAAAVHGDHPLGRRVLGDAEVIDSIPVAEIMSYHDARYTGPNLVVAAAGHLEHERIVELAERQFGRRPVSEMAFPRRPSMRPCRGSSSRLRRPSSTTSASGGRGSHAPTRDVHAGDPGRDLWRLHLVAPVSGGAREAGTRLLGWLLQRAVRRLRHGRDVRWHPRGQRPRSVRDHRPRALHASRSRRQRRGAGASQGACEGPAGARA